METKKQIVSSTPEPTIRRLPMYLSYLKNFLSDGREYISAPHIASDLRIDATTRTKDLAYIGISGKPKIGYSVPVLINYLEEFLGYNRNDLAFLVGAGNLGTALLKYEGFKNTGLRIVAAFDNDTRKIGGKIGGVEILPIDKLRNMIERMHIAIGIITTPEGVAQSIADMMIGWGIKAIWNFTPAIIKAPEGIFVENTSIYSNLAVIINKIQNQ
ncbi:MAG: redox-sensing transcriptional repressor Rex [Bacteroidota bacterium]|nr:redox-sensing transcriptional repressor Rex [Bacteroidota bacterium]